MLSQSLYVPSHDPLFQSMSEKKNVPVVRDMSKELLRLKQYNLDVKPALNTKYEIEKIYNDFEDAMTSYNFQQVIAPFITNSFHVQRKNAFKKLETLTSEFTFAEKMAQYQKFIDKVDRHFLVRFQYMIKEPYVNLVFQQHYNIPKNVEMKQVKDGDAYQELYNLSVIISIWSIEMELAADLIERAILYKLYQPKNEKADTIQKLKEKKSLDKKFSHQGFSKKLMRSLIAKLINKMSSFFSAKGFSFNSISWTACQGIVYYLMGKAAFPWALMAGSVSIPWICGGFLATKLLEKVGKQISKIEVLDDIRLLEVAFRENREEMMIQYAEISDVIAKCFSAGTEKELKFFKESLNRKIENMLDPNYNAPVPKQKGTLHQSRLCISMLRAQEADDWVICDFEDGNEDEEDQDASDDIVLA